MKLSYWNAYTRQIPFTWSGIDDYAQPINKSSSVIRVVGHNHTPVVLQWLYHVASDYIDHIFLIFSNNINSFTNCNIPSNVMPFLQLDSSQDNNIITQTFCELDIPNFKGLSYYCNKAVKYIPNNIDWIFLAGPSLNNIKKTLDTCDRRNVAAYVEKYKHKNWIPDEIDIKECPSKLMDDLTPLSEYINMYNEQLEGALV